MVILNPYLFVFFSMKWHSPEAIVNTILKTAICKRGISFWSSEHRKEMPHLQMAVFQMVFTIASWLCHFIEKIQINMDSRLPLITAFRKGALSSKDWIQSLGFPKTLLKTFPKILNNPWIVLVLKFTAFRKGVISLRILYLGLHKNSSN